MSVFVHFQRKDQSRKWTKSLTKLFRGDEYSNNISTGKYCKFQTVNQSSFSLQRKYSGYASKYLFKKEFTDVLEDKYSWYFGQMYKMEAKVKSKIFVF